MAEEEMKAKEEAEELARRQPKSIPVIGASSEPEESASGSVNKVSMHQNIQ